MGNTFMKLAKEELVKLHGIESCKRTAEIPTSDLYFTFLRENVERDYSKYKDDLTEDEYAKFIEDIFVVHKEYKLSLDKAEETEYGQIYGDCAEKILGVLLKYGLKTKRM